MPVPYKALGAIASAALALASCLSFPAQAADAGSAMPLCSDAYAVQLKRPDMKAAVAAAFGQHVRYLPKAEAGADDAPACQSLAALLRFDGADVLITSHTDGGPVGHATAAQLSAYFLRREGGSLKLVTVARDFADGEDGWGMPGDIMKVRLGSDDGMVVSGGYAAQGETTSTAAFYAFRNGGVVSLGSIPMGWDNSGVGQDSGKAIAIDGKFDAANLQTSRVPVVYVRQEQGKAQIFQAMWRSDGEKFVLESGAVPRDLVDNFELPADMVSANGTPPGGAPALPGKKE